MAPRLPDSESTSQADTPMTDANDYEAANTADRVGQTVRFSLSFSPSTRHTFVHAMNHCLLLMDGVLTQHVLGISRHT